MQGVGQMLCIPTTTRENIHTKRLIVSRPGDPSPPTEHRVGKVLSSLFLTPGLYDSMIF